MTKLTKQIYPFVVKTDTHKYTVESVLNTDVRIGDAKTNAFIREQIVADYKIKQAFVTTAIDNSINGCDPSKSCGSACPNTEVRDYYLVIVDRDIPSNLPLKPPVDKIDRQWKIIVVKYQDSVVCTYNEVMDSSCKVVTNNQLKFVMSMETH